jgi:hypothetical protein
LKLLVLFVEDEFILYALKLLGLHLFKLLLEIFGIVS